MRFACLSGRTVPMSGQVWRVAGTLVLVAGLAGAVPASPAAAAVERVEMAGVRFSPARVEIEIGDSVIWEAGDDSHTVTARDGSFDSSPRGLIGEGEEYRFRFRVPGKYAYYCRVHQNRGMQGEVVVIDPSAPTTTSTTPVTPVTAAATTTSTAPTTTTAPVTTTSRELATSSTTSRSIATTTTALTGTPVAPQEPPALNPNTPTLDPAGDFGFSEAQAAARRAKAEDERMLYLVALGLFVALGAAGGGIAYRRARRT